MVGGQHQAPAALSPGKTVYPLHRRQGVASGTVWKGAESVSSTGLRYPDRPVRSESL